MFSRRVTLSFLSLFVLAFPVYFIQAVFRFEQNRFSYPLAAYLFFIVCSGILLASIAARLFRLHGFGRYSFDLGFWFLFSALLALPLGVANIIFNALVFLQNDPNELTIKIGLSIGFYFLLIPVLLLTEAFVSLAAFVAQRRKF